MAKDAVATGAVESAAHITRRVTDHYERRGRELWGMARRLGVSDESAADVLQETHLRLWRELQSGTGASAHPARFSVAVVRGRAG